MERYLNGPHMPNFQKRSTAEELLDQKELDRKELFLNLEELDTINRLLGGHKATLIGIKHLLKDPNRTYHIVDFACGGGDTLRAIARWGKKNGFQLTLTGFDLLPEAIEYAKNNSNGYNIKFEQADFYDFKNTKPIDIACCALVCHHFYDEKLLAFLKKMKQLASLGVVINDLHRHPFAYHSIKALTKVLSKSVYVKHDAALSVLKGFRKHEWQEVLKEAGYHQYQLDWIWAFRHLIVQHNTHE